MVNHVWGLLTHPGQELDKIRRENESVGHLYTHHVLLLAAIPVICAFIGTTQVGWQSGDGTGKLVSLGTAASLAVLFYVMILAGVAVMGQVIHWLARNYNTRPSWHRCCIFAGYVATPLFLSGIVALYPLLWVCLFVGIVALCYSGYLLYLGIPNLLAIEDHDSVMLSSAIFAIGILLLEMLLALTVVLWGYGSGLL